MAFDMLHQGYGAARSEGKGVVEPMQAERFAEGIAAFENAVGIQKQGITRHEEDFALLPAVVCQDRQGQAGGAVQLTDRAATRAQSRAWLAAASVARRAIVGFCAAIKGR